MNRRRQRRNAEDYRGEHQAPDELSGAPLWDVTLNGIYPRDFYGRNPWEYVYGGTGDSESIGKIVERHLRPDRKVWMYRAVPRTPTVGEQLRKLEKQRAYVLRYGEIPRGVRTPLDPDEYYEWLLKEIAALAVQPRTRNKQITKINDGDWVTISRAYAQEHGRSNLGGLYRVIQQRIQAWHLFTDGNSPAEWGYVANPDPTPALKYVAMEKLR